MKKNMKKISVWLLTIIAGVSMTAMVSCNKDNGGDDPDDGKIDPSTIATANLIAYFPFEGNGNDAIGGLTPGQSANATFPTGRRGQAYQGASDAYMAYSLPTSSKIKTLKSFSIAMWAKIIPNDPANNAPEDMIFQVDGRDDWQKNFFLKLIRNNPEEDTVKLTNYFWKEDAPSWNGQNVSNIHSPGYLFNAWLHLTFTYNGATSKWYAYLNGDVVDLPEAYTDRKCEDGSAFGELKFENPQKLFIGAYAQKIDGGATDAWMGNYRGQLDEFRMYDRALTADEVKSLYQAEATQINE
jgi:hypothetical protein